MLIIGTPEPESRIKYVVSKNFAKCSVNSSKSLALSIMELSLHQPLSSDITLHTVDAIIRLTKLIRGEVAVRIAYLCITKFFLGSSTNRVCGKIST